MVSFLKLIALKDNICTSIHPAFDKIVDNRQKSISRVLLT